MSGLAEQSLDAFSSVFQKGGGFESVFSGLLSSLGRALQDLGKYLIMVGGLKSVIDKAVASLGQIGGGVVTIAAGIASVAAGALLQRAATNKTRHSFRAFADGGIVSGPTMGLVGEYANASVDPEVIAPLSKLQGMLSDMAPVNVNVVGEVRGRDLALIMDRQYEFRNR